LSGAWQAVVQNNQKWCHLYCTAMGCRMLPGVEVVELEGVSLSGHECGDYNRGVFTVHDLPDGIYCIQPNFQHDFWESSLYL